MTSPVDLSKVKATFGGGASPYGNFYNYYNFNPVSERFSFFPSDFAVNLWRRKRELLKLGGASDELAERALDTLSFLDVGCNEGNISIEMAALLAHQLGSSDLPSRVQIKGLGVDIDSVLIKRAIQKVAEYDFLSTPSNEHSSTDETVPTEEKVPGRALTAVTPSANSFSRFHFELSFLCGSMMDTATRRIVRDYARGIDFPPGVLASTYSTSPSQRIKRNAYAVSEASQTVSLSTSETDDVQASSADNTVAHISTPPGNVSSADLDVPSSPPLSTPPPFDVVFVFSVTLWIHIHHGDEGLRTFLRSLAALTHNIVIEPQPWKCYLTCKKRWRKAGQSIPATMDALEWRTDVDERIITFLERECGFEVRACFGETKWERRLVWLARKVEE